MIDGWRRCVIDTQGLDDHCGVDAEHIQQMVQFLRHYEHGVNVVALVINGHADRVTTGTQKLIRLLHVFFRDIEFWHRLCIVFTKCFAGLNVSKNIKTTKYQEIIKSLAMECVAESDRSWVSRMPLPVYFVDSPTWQPSSAKPSETDQELTALHAFVVGVPPLPTQYVAAPNPKWYKIESETEANVLVSTREEMIPNGVIHISRFQDRERDRRTDYDGISVSFSEWREIRTWEERRTFTVQVETVTELITPQRTMIVGGSGEGQRFGVRGPYRDGQAGMSTEGPARYRTKQRTKTTAPDGKVIYGDWATIHEWDAVEDVAGGERARARHTSSTGPVGPEDIQVRRL
jgi:hypothetical protein